MQNVSEFIAAKREKLGFTDEQMARRVGLSLSEYWDIEFHDYELATLVSLMHVRRLAEAIDVSVCQLFGLAPRDDGPLHGKRSAYIADARKAIGASVAEMADGIGFLERFVENLEIYDDFLELYPFEVLLFIAAYLKVPPQHLLGRRNP